MMTGPAAALLTTSVARQIQDGPVLIALPIALAAGLLSFASPCVLPLVPGYLSYITGMSAADLAGAGVRRERVTARPQAVVRQPGARVLLGAWLFILGFALVFVTLGAAFGGLGGMLRAHETTLTRVFGLITILLGLSFAGAFRRLRIASAEIRFHRPRALGLAGAPVLGMMFGWAGHPASGPPSAPPSASPPPPARPRNAARYWHSYTASASGCPSPGSGSRSGVPWPRSP